MLCKKPYMYNHLLPVGCGKCLPCRISRRRLWTHRILMEASKNVESAFTTLTYEEAELPKGGSLDPKHLQGFFKRLRFRLAPRKLRYYACGEYGEDFERPHYHAAIFGLGRKDYGEIKEAWGYGTVYTRELEKNGAQYVAGYVCKKVSGLDGKEKTWLNGRYPEFARMSKRPGLGSSALPEVRDLLTHPVYSEAIFRNGNGVPMSLSYDGRQMPLGRYLMKKLRSGIGDEVLMSEDALFKYAEKMSEMFALSEGEKKRSAGGTKSWSNREKLLNENRSAVKKLERKFKLFGKKGSYETK